MASTGATKQSPRSKQQHADGWSESSSHELLQAHSLTPVEPTSRSRKRRTSPRLSLSRRNSRRVPAGQRMRTFYRRFRQLLRWFGPAIAVSGLFLVGSYGWEQFCNSPQFALQQIVYPKNLQNTLPKAVLMQYAGLKKGQNLLQIKLQQLAQKLQRHPRIRFVRLRRELPGRLVIELKTRQPVAVAILGGPYYLDKQGRPFARVEDPKRAKGLLQITGFRRFDYQRDPQSTQKLFQKSLAVARIYQRRRLSRYQRLQEVQYDPVLGYILRTQAGNVYIGERHLNEKMKQLQRIYRLFWQRGVHKLRYVYLNHRNHPRRAIVRIDDAILVTQPSQNKKTKRVPRKALQQEPLQVKNRLVQASMRGNL